MNNRIKKKKNKSTVEKAAELLIEKCAEIKTVNENQCIVISIDTNYMRSKYVSVYEFHKNLKKMMKEKDVPVIIIPKPFDIDVEAKDIDPVIRYLESHKKKPSKEYDGDLND